MLQIRQFYLFIQMGKQQEWFATQEKVLLKLCQFLKDSQFLMLSTKALLQVRQSLIIL